MVDSIMVQLNRIKDEGKCGVSITETPEVDGYMFAVFSVEDGSVLIGHWICHNTPDSMKEEFENLLKRL